LGGCPLLHGYRVPARSKPHRIRRALARTAVPGRALARSSRIRDRVAPSPPLERTSRPALASDRLQPRFHGPGAGRLSPPGTSRCDSSRRELRPNPIGSDTSCRELVAPRLEADDTGSRRTCWEARVTGPVTSPPREPAFAMPATAPTRPAHAGPPGQEKLLAQPSTGSDGCSLARTPSGAKGRLTRSSAKRTAIRCTRGAFHPWVAPSGAGRSPQLVSNLWKTSGAFLILALPCRP